MKSSLSAAVLLRLPSVVRMLASIGLDTDCGLFRRVTGLAAGLRILVAGFPADPVGLLG
jgi:hypothetical protein